MCIALAQRLLGRLTLLAKFFQQSAEVFGVLLFLGEDFFHHPTAGRIVAAEVIDDFAIAVDRDALGNQIFLQHFDNVLAFDVVLMRTRPEAIRRSEANTSELQSLMRTSYAAFCLKKQNTAVINNSNSSIKQ